MRYPQTNSKSFYFSHRAIESISLPTDDHPSTSIEFSDTAERGLKLAVYKSGIKTFRQRYTIHGKKKSLTLGEFPGLPLEQARKRVQENKQLISDEIDPKDKRRDALTFKEFVDQHYAPFAKAELKSWRDIENRIKLRLIPEFGDIPLPNLNKSMVSTFHRSLREEISSTTANRYLALISGIYNKAIEWGFATENPARGLTKAKESGARTRVLSMDELTRFLTALNNNLEDATRMKSARAIYLLITLGLRKMEVLSLRWEHIKFENKTAYLPVTKSGKPRHINLNSLALELLKQMSNDKDASKTWVFPSKSNSGHLLEVRRTFEAITQEASIEGLRTHDLRRTFASNLANSGIQIYEIRDLLGHADVRTTQIYAHLGNECLQNASEKAADILNQALRA